MLPIPIQLEIYPVKYNQGIFHWELKIYLPQSCKLHTTNGRRPQITNHVQHIFLPHPQLKTQHLKLKIKDSVVNPIPVFHWRTNHHCVSYGTQ